MADRFPARALLAIALVSTAAGGVVMMAVPPLSTLVVLYAYWGVTTIALFWGPLIRATRQWGGDNAQGRAFGLLDGGRGLLAAVIGLIMVTFFASFLPADSETANHAQRTEALRQIILLLSVITGLAALLVWLVLPRRDLSQARKEANLSLRDIGHCSWVPLRWGDNLATYLQDEGLTSGMPHQAREFISGAAQSLV